jgi:hypothetical protein
MSSDQGDAGPSRIGGGLERIYHRLLTHLATETYLSVSNFVHFLMRLARKWGQR